jgi:hypothetical protein
MEPNAELSRRLDLVIDLMAALEHVGVVEHGRAARQGELGKPDQGACP